MFSSVCPEGAGQVAQNPVKSANSKHINVRRPLLREPVHQRDISTVIHVPSEYQHADILTTALD